jgi:hypothetical protein
MRPLLRSFAGGEITPELYGRLDLQKYQTGLATCLNFRTQPHGPAERRTGFEFVAEAKDSTRLVRRIPFSFSADQTAVLEFGHLYVRMHIDGEALLEADKAVVSIAGSTVTVTGHAWSTGDDVYIGSPGRFHRITSTGANTFTTTDLWGAATTAVGSTAARVYTLTTPYTEDDLFNLHYAQDSDVLTITCQGCPAKELRRLGAANWTLTDIDFAPSADVPQNVAVVETNPTTTSPQPQNYVVTAIYADGITESLASAVVSASNNLSYAGNYNTLTWDALTGATRYNVYKQRGGSFGYIGQTVALTIVDDNVLADTTKTPPEDIYELNTGTGDYPAATTYYEQRRWFAGTADSPQSVWATRNATQANLTSSIPSQDDDGMQFRIASQQQNSIRHLLPLADLIALTVGGEFRIYADNAPNITPSSLSIKPQGYAGASMAQPVLTSGSILYVQAQGARIRELAYNWQSNAYASIDISIMAPHLFSGYTVTDLAFQQAPVPTLWCVRSDGALLAMTYVPEQQVYGWHRHTTNGHFESVCVVSEGYEDVLYASVRRTVNGRQVRYLERLRSAAFTAQEDAFFVDCGLTYDGAPATTISGLYHLEGMTVQILADGAVQPNQVVAGGTITLVDAASVVHVGLQYSSDLVTLPVVLEGMQAAGQGVTKNVNGVRMRVRASSVVKGGPSFDKLITPPSRAVTDPYDSPPALRTEEIRFAFTPTWAADGQICLRQDLPLPLTVLSIAPDVATGG